MIPSNVTYVCEICGAKVPMLRRGRCWICYMRWAESRPAGLGASCAVCGERRRDNLRMVEFKGSWVSLCHNCGTKLLKLSPMPATIEGVRQRLIRDRRWQVRRSGNNDHRTRPLERRISDRRTRSLFPDAEIPIDWLDAEELIVEIVEDLEETSEATRIVPHACEKPKILEKAINPSGISPTEKITQPSPYSE